MRYNIHIVKENKGENKMKSKLIVTLKQWEEIRNNELNNYSEFVNKEKVQQAEQMVIKLNKMIADAK